MGGGVGYRLIWEWVWGVGYRFRWEWVRMFGIDLDGSGWGGG